MIERMTSCSARVKDFPDAGGSGHDSNSGDRSVERNV
jgi:hypothetical protein